MGNREELQACLDFFRAQSHILIEEPEVLFQLAANSANGSVLASKSELRLSTGVERRPWLRLVNQTGRKSGCLLKLEGHNNRVNTCAFSSDGKKVVSGEWILKLWDAGRGEEILSLSIGDELTSCAFSPDGNSIVFGSIRGWGSVTIQLWDIRAGVKITTLYAAEDYWKTYECTFSPDGCLIAAAGGSIGTGGIRVFNASSHTELVHLEIDDSEAYLCAFSVDGKLLAGASKNSLKVWDTTSWTEKFVLNVFPKIHSENFQGTSDDIASPRKLIFTSDKNDLVVAFNQTAAWQSVQDLAELTVKRWSVDTWHEDQTISIRKKVGPLALSPDGSCIAYSIVNDLFLWYPKDPDTELLLGANVGLTSFEFSRDGRRLVGISDRTVQIWDTNATNAPTQKRDRHSDDVRFCTFSPDGATFVTASDDHSLKIWDGCSGQPIRTLESHMAAPKGHLLSPDGEKLLSWDESRRMALLLNFRTGEEIAWLGPHVYQILAAAFSPDASRVVTGTGLYDRCEFWMWDTETGRRVLEFNGHTSWITACAFSADGSRLVSASDDQTVRLWEVKSGKQVAVLADKDEWVAVWTTSPDGSRIAGGTFVGTVKIWDCQSGTCIATLNGHKDAVTHCVSSPDAKFFATASRDGLIRVWDSQTGSEIETHQHKRLTAERGSFRASVAALLFSPDAQRLISIHEDSTILMWNAAKPSERMQWQNNRVTRCVDFTPDGAFIWLWGKSGSILCCDALTGSKIASYRPDGPAQTVAVDAKGSRLCLGDTTGRVDLLQLENMQLSPPLVNAFCSPGEGAPATRCPFCRRWTIVADTQLGAPLQCEHCKRELRLNTFKLNVDWRALQGFDTLEQS